MSRRMSLVMATLAQIVREQRQRADLSRVELAQAAAVPLSTLIKIEQGLIRNPHWWTLVALGRALGVSLDTFGGAEPPKAKDD